MDGDGEFRGPTDPDDPKAAPLAGGGPVPRRDGLYVDVEPETVMGDLSCTHYVRFTDPDRVSTVTCVTGAEMIPLICRWFGPRHEGSSQGTYHLDGAAISFAATDGSGTVEYVGRLAEDALTLFVDTHSLINDHRSRRELRFVRADFPNG
ncbi:hypothetical protein ACWGR4_43795 [Embleya sp. NPDC055664]